jgi:hypothetical protein
MKVILIFCSVVCFLGCITPKPQALPTTQNPTTSQQQQPVISTPVIKTCVEILEEEVKKGWHKYDPKTNYVSFIENLDLLDTIVGPLSTCIIGKNKEFVTKILGKPSSASIGIFKYHLYKEGETNLLTARCLTFRMKDGKTITSVSYEECGYKKL